MKEIKNKKAKLIVLVYSIIIIFSLIIFYPIDTTIAENPIIEPIPDYDDFDYHIWFFSDAQPQHDSSYCMDYDGRFAFSWKMPLQDANNLSWDVGVCVGDLIEGDFNDATEYQNIIEGYEDYLYNYMPSNLSSNLPIDDYPYFYDSSSNFTSNSGGIPVVIQDVGFTSASESTNKINFSLSLLEDKEV